ncbi:M28 family metallopeptidase [Sinomicrobium soli]|uniref:M28 family metallopeptidase n=1 Tax=Sinomicrobium sp. N-1-3-6 TaxID=2219864 RepID=UPI000DCDC3CB|nr:M28 family metallopeptidase [Sinomicrobium sp. N-1-3-6]RAV30616.1 peptidase [Sinomicrobium sp. N-1-3-6]
MRKLVYLALSLAFACNSSQKATTPIQKKADYDPVPYAGTITREELKDHLYTYASDEFEGRETGKPGQKKAVEYLKKHYVDLGIPAAQGNGDYFQKVPLIISTMPEGTASVSGQQFQIGEDLVALQAPARKEYTADEIVYAGYGIDTPEYSDFDGIDVQDKIIVIAVGEPKNDDGTYVISGTATPSKWSDLKISLPDRLDIADKKGAKGVLIFDGSLYTMILQQYNFMKTRSAGGRMQLDAEEDNDFFYAFVSPEMAGAIAPDLENMESGAAVKTDFRITFTSESEHIDSENVVAYIKGSEKPEEYVVISSHLDHIGVNDDGQINNGADDDGSGTVAMLEIAQAFKKAADDGNGPKRSVVFLHVTGEEKGLLGSDYYTRKPVFPLENTVTDLNIDMIGRIDPKREGDRNYVYLIGSDKLSTELHNLSEEVNKKYCNIELDYTFNDDNDPNRFYYRSDHYNFAKNNIPVIFYFNGTHDDYHQPGDTPDKINYDLLENRARLVFHTAWEVANRDKRLVVDKAMPEE